MAEAILMPRQGQSVESCIIGQWHKQKGDKVEVGDKLFTYETDKATFDEEAQVAGHLIAVFFAEGDDVPVLTNVCVIGAEGEDWSQYVPEGATVDGAGAPAKDKVEPEQTAKSDTEEAAEPVRQPETVEKAEPVAVAAEAVDMDRPISPRAKAAAEKYGVDLRFADGTGPDGRIIERDIDRLVAAGKVHTPAAGTAYDSRTAGTGLGGRVRIEDTKRPLPKEAVLDGPEYVDTKLPQIRKLIAKAMHESIAGMAQLTLNNSFDATDILAYRERIKKAQEKGLGDKLNLSLPEKAPTINDIVLYVVSRVALLHEDANAHFLDDVIRRFTHVQLGVAVDTPRGLMVPVIRNADTLSIEEIASEVRRLASDAQSGTINPDEIRGGTITVTNLGGLGIEHFTPVINPPETCILGVNKIKTAVRVEDGNVVGYPEMTLSLTFDHRAWDGAPAARFLADVCLALENFTLFIASGQ